MLYGIPSISLKRQVINSNWQFPLILHAIGAEEKSRQEERERDIQMTTPHELQNKAIVSLCRSARRKYKYQRKIYIKK